MPEPYHLLLRQGMRPMRRLKRVIDMMNESTGTTVDFTAVTNNDLTLLRNWIGLQIAAGPEIDKLLLFKNSNDDITELLES